MKDIKIGVIGLGYVGLPLARLFSTKYPTVGFDINATRIERLSRGVDDTLEVDSELLLKAFADGFRCTCDPDELRECNFYVVTVPTPVDNDKNPDITLLLKASETVGRVISPGDYVVYESTVYPGATEQECIPVVERTSGLKLNKDFYAGYSPERINPGDKLHTVEKIRKVTSGSTPEAAGKIDGVYGSVIDAGTFMASSIMVAEAAKVIENSQRDINIAFVNELAKIFNRIGIDTNEVLEAAGTKWNFMPFKPGLVGGHCIGVDPYYLAQCSQRYGYLPEIILAGRRLNDGMGQYVAERAVLLMQKKRIPVEGAEVLVLGVTFKENCPDIRNTKVTDIVSTLESYGARVTIFDPRASADEVQREYGFGITNELPRKKFDAVILAVAHSQFLETDISGLRKENSVVYDIKGCLDPSIVDERL